MKKLLLVFAILLPVFACASYKVESKIDKLARPYEKAVESLASLDTKAQLDDYTIYQYFTESGLSTHKDRKKFHRSLEKIKVLAKNNNFSAEQANKIDFLIDNLNKVQNFVVEYATTDYAYYDIAAYYHYVSEQEANLIDILIETSTQLMLPSMHGRGLYKFVKKIDLDLRRLNALFVNKRLSDSIIFKMKQLKNKLLIIKDAVEGSYEYQQQVTKTRWLKASVLLIPIVMFIAVFITAIISPANGIVAVAAYVVYFIPLLLGSFIISVIGINIRDVYEARKYDIPVRGTSIFSFS